MHKFLCEVRDLAVPLIYMASIVQMWLCPWRRPSAASTSTGSRKTSFAGLCRDDLAPLIDKMDDRLFRASLNVQNFMAVQTKISTCMIPKDKSNSVGLKMSVD